LKILVFELKIELKNFLEKPRSFSGKIPSYFSTKTPGIQAEKISIRQYYRPK